MFARDSPFILKNHYRYHRVVRRLFRNANCASRSVSDSRGRLGFDPRPVLPLESTKKHELQINMEIEDVRGKKFDATRRCPNGLESLRRDRAELSSPSCRIRRTR